MSQWKPIGDSIDFIEEVYQVRRRLFSILCGLQNQSSDERFFNEKAMLISASVIYAERLA